MLDEQAKRRPEWTEGRPITLCDGQSWMLPVPVLGDYYFVREPDGTTSTRRGRTFGAAYELLLDRYLEADSGSDQAVALFDLAFDLLGRNYTLTVDDCRSLLRIVPTGEPTREANEVMWEAIAEAALGRAPKATAVGSGPPSSPTA